MSKILKNTTGSIISIADTGISIPASPGSYTIPIQDYTLWGASTSVSSFITSGALVINDGYNDLTAVNGANYLKYPDTALNIRFLSNPDRANGFTAKDVQTAIEEAKASAVSGTEQHSWSSIDSNLVILAKRQMIVYQDCEVESNMNLELQGELIIIT